MSNQKTKSQKRQGGKKNPFDFIYFFVVVVPYFYLLKKMM